MPTDVTSLSDLAAAADVTPRTVRYYISQGLLPGPAGQGSAARYTPVHLARLRAIRHLADAGLSLARIRDHLSRMGDDDVERLADAADSDQARRADEDPGASALAYIRQVLSPTSASGSEQPTMLASIAREPTRLRWEPPAPEEFSPPGAPPARLPAPQPLMLPQSSPWTEPGADRSTWERIALTPDIELHVRRPLDRRTNKLLERLLEHARHLFGGR